MCHSGAHAADIEDHAADNRDHANKTTRTMILETRAVGPFMKNGFVLGCERTREGVVIDPGDEVDELSRSSNGSSSRSATSC
jgi:hypothetical protein